MRTVQSGNTGLREALRRETDSAHRRLDAGWDGHDLTDRDAYGSFLAAFAGALLPLEAALDAAWADGAGVAMPPDWPERRRRAALLADLAGLGWPPGPFVSAPDGVGAAERIGLLYVLEGSRLGGQVLLKRVLASPDARVRDNVRFLRHGEGRRLWPVFATWLAQGDDVDRKGAVAGALQAFAMFEAAQAAVQPLPG